MWRQLVWSSWIDRAKSTATRSREAHHRSLGTMCFGIYYWKGHMFPFFPWNLDDLPRYTKVIYPWCGYTLQWFGYFPYCFLIIYHPIWEMNGTVCDPRRSRNMQTVFLWVEETTKWWACLTSLYRICQICEYLYIYWYIYIYTVLLKCNEMAPYYQTCGILQDSSSPKSQPWPMDEGSSNVPRPNPTSWTSCGERRGSNDRNTVIGWIMLGFMLGLMDIYWT